MNLHSLTIHELQEKLKKKEISSVELTQSTLERITHVDDKIHSYITVCRETALEEAKKADTQRRRKGSPSPLLGIPIANGKIL